MFEKILGLIDYFRMPNPQFRDHIKERGQWGFGSSVYNYYFMNELEEKDYPKYLKNAYYVQMNKKLNLKRPKTLSEKVQWLKIYDNSPIKTELTDKVLARDYVKNCIGEKYLKPVLQICDTFEEIDFDKLPNRFIVKCNHGCKWHFVVKNKEEYLNNKFIYSYTEKIFSNWLKQNFFGWSDFETQYKNIVPKVIIEPMLCSENCRSPYEIEVMCFNSNPKIIKTYDNNSEATCFYDENYNSIDLKLIDNNNIKYENTSPNETLKVAAELSEKLAKDFKFVRVDWFLYDGNLYFNEMTFTPFSGYFRFPQGYEHWDKKLGDMLNLKGN